MNKEEDIRQAVEVMRRGGVILYPTDTIWGIGCDATNEEAVRRVYDIKKRDEIDSSRAASPLKPAEDAVHLDSTGKTIEEIISFICSRAEQAQR